MLEGEKTASVEAVSASVCWVRCHLPGGLDQDFFKRTGRHGTGACGFEMFFKFFQQFFLKGFGNGQGERSVGDHPCQNRGA